MLWVKAFHVIFMVTWFAGLFYLPRLFVYHADTHDQAGHDRFVIMERKLFIIMTIGAVLTALFGIWMLIDYAWAAFSSNGWLHAKLLLIFLLLYYHHMCWKIVKTFAAGENKKSHKYYRMFNEVPVLGLMAIIILVVVKPF